MEISLEKTEAPNYYGLALVLVGLGLIAVWVDFYLFKKEVRATRKGGPKRRKSKTTQ